MSVQDLQASLQRVADQARGYDDLLKKFKSKNDEDLSDAQEALSGNRTGTAGEVKSSLDEAGAAIEEAARAMDEAASAAEAYAQNI